MNAPPPVSDVDACRSWLDAEIRAYADDPCSAQDRLAPTMALFEQVVAGEPGDFGVELAWHLTDLCGELWRSEQIESVLDAVMPWVAAGFGEKAAIPVLSLRCRMHLRFGRLPPALVLLDEITRRAAASPWPVDQAHCSRALGNALSLQRQFEPAIAAMQEAIRLFRASGDRGRWVDIYASISIAHRHLGRRDEEQHVLREGLSVAVAQRRWISACNAGASLAEELMIDGREDEAVALLHEAETSLRLAGAGGERIAKELFAAQAALAWRQGDAYTAIALMRRVVDDSRKFSMRRQVVHRLKQLARWQEDSGRTGDALASLREAHALELEDTRESSRLDSATTLHRIEVAHAQQLKARAEAHADELADKARALQQALDLQRQMQAELIERSKLATLGHLLAGVAHEMNTPLGSALTVLSTVTELNAGLVDRLTAGTVSRRHFTTELERCQESAELARRNVEQALALVQSYQHIDARHAVEPTRRISLGCLVEAAWRRAMSPGTALTLRRRVELDAELPAEALTEVLLQLFQNVERHAYAAGQAGVVEVEARAADGAVMLSVTDHGRGIPAELLPRVFDPYVSTQFGRGRSGLGLFVAHVTVLQRLRGRLTVDSAPGRGCRLEIEFPVG
ncbi:HAMP domain-containing sensor histidine kinase [Mitsuaria sp. GD03876]|uniref:HAMP domain-containing sensor histidine kinase n=1 Tax=Mitsuaria sp. GD03876 TaxID=2975399 RepID=UPI00244C74F5|nr:HAMP domain-containing sensor histidine kinase [Mitsuaria sp. GD03876]MDH0863989.1 HAMP domain-containing histidine kinase [Mitsuaria sp. GD03876]